MNLILSRHGNTFGPNDPVVWTGSSNDLPLVDQGYAQAERLAQALLNQKIQPKAICCSPLQRTSQYANLLIQRLKLSYHSTVDPRLNELDYGEWTGLTQAEVISRFGEKAFRGWEERSEWPAEGKWRGSPDQVKGEVRSFVQELVLHSRETDVVVAVTSNGRLRYFLSLVDGEFEKRIQNRTFKVKTGHVCKLICTPGKVEVAYWNEDPSRLHQL